MCNTGRAVFYSLSSFRFWGGHRISRRPASGVSFPARRSRPLDFLGICDILEKEAPVANGLPHIRLKSDFLSDLARSVCNTGRAIFYSLSFFRLRRRRRAMSMIILMTAIATIAVSYVLIAAASLFRYSGVAAGRARRQSALSHGCAFTIQYMR